MKKLALTVAAATALTLCAGAASAAPWTSINARQARLDDRIDAGVRTGALTRSEAARLRTDFNGLARLEHTYRRHGLTNWERADLDRRFDALSARIKVQRADGQRDWFGGHDWRDNRGQWVSINQRQRELDQRIDQGMRSGQLTGAEAARLRADFRQIAQIEARYRRNGLSQRERTDLDRRFDQLAAQVRSERHDGQRQYGWNR